MSTSFLSPSLPSSLPSTKSSASKSPLREPRTPETVSQYSFHIVNAAVTRLRTSVLLFTGDLVPPTRRLRRRRRRHRRRRRRSCYLPLFKDGYYLRETKVPSFVKSPSYLFIFTLPEHSSMALRLVFSAPPQLPLTAYLCTSPSAPEIECRA